MGRPDTRTNPQETQSQKEMSDKKKPEALLTGANFEASPEGFDVRLYNVDAGFNVAFTGSAQSLSIAEQYELLLPLSAALRQVLKDKSANQALHDLPRVG